MDFATVLSPNLAFDWAIANGDLASDAGLFTAVAISGFTDLLANADDELPDNSGDRRGWWGDAYLPPLTDGTPDHIGSRLWLLTRAKQLPETAQRAQAYLQEALAWLVDDGVAAAVTVPLPIFPRYGMMAIVVIVSQLASAGAAPTNVKFDILWDMTRGAPAQMGIAIGGF